LPEPAFGVLDDFSGLAQAGGIVCARL